MRPLVIDRKTMERIADAIANARANPVPIEVLEQFEKAPDHVSGGEVPTYRLKDRRPLPGLPVGEEVLIAFGYRVLLTFEEQRHGLVRHISISVDKPGKMPHPEAVEMILEAFRFDRMRKGTSRVYFEEFAPGHEAVNILQMDKAIIAGNA